jgi:hypothetical protein
LKLLKLNNVGQICYLELLRASEDTLNRWSQRLNVLKKERKKKENTFIGLHIKLKQTPELQKTEVNTHK